MVRPILLATAILLVATSARADDGGGSGSPLATFVHELGSDDPDVRKRATSRLLEVGLEAVPVLRLAVEDDDPERAARARLVLRRILGPSVARRLVGDWRFVEVVEDGKSEKSGIGAFMRFEDGQCTFLQKDGRVKVEPARYLVDVTHEPMHVDFVAGRRRTNGLFALEGDELEIVYSMLTNDDRPRAIDPKRTKGLRYFRLERVVRDD